MRLSKYLLPTLREVPAEAEITSHQLMLRAGLMRKLASGVYSYLPLGYKTLRNVEKIVREAGYEVILVDTSEYRKIDGGLSCLSLRF